MGNTESSSEARRIIEAYRNTRKDCLDEEKIKLLRRIIKLTKGDDIEFYSFALRDLFEIYMKMGKYLNAYEILSTAKKYIKSGLVQQLKIIFYLTDGNMLKSTEKALVAFGKFRIKSNRVLDVPDEILTKLTDIAIASGDRDTIIDIFNVLIDHEVVFTGDIRKVFIETFANEDVLSEINIKYIVKLYSEMQN